MLWLNAFAQNDAHERKQKKIYRSLVASVLFVEVWWLGPDLFFVSTCLMDSHYELMLISLKTIR